MKDKYFLLNGRSYPDTVDARAAATVADGGQMHYSQPCPPSSTFRPAARLCCASRPRRDRILDSRFAAFHDVVGFNAKLLRDQAGNNLYFYTNSITLGGGESLDVVLDASDDSPSSSC